MSTKVLRDPGIGLDCTETPFRPPKTLSRNDLAVCSSCELLFSSDVVGPKDIVVLDKGGLQINESPLVQITYNNATYGLANSFLWPQGIHRNFKVDVNFDLELNLYFRDVYSPDKWMGVVIPITIDDSNARPYFSEINTGRRTINIETLIEKDKPVLVYKGIDLRTRDAAKKQTAAQCLSLNSTLTWFVLPTTFISNVDANRMRSFRLPVSNTIPAPDHEITLERARKLCMMIPNIVLKRDSEAKKRVGGDSGAGVYLTRALQCQRIDPVKDVRGDAVYLNAPPERTLHKELEDSANLNKTIDAKSKSGVRANDVENILALVVGITVGVILISLVAYGVYSLLFKQFIGTLETMETTILTTPVPCKPPLII
jgi:hypothetical protein